LDSLNNTDKAESDIIIFNRVPRAGSQMFIELMKKLAIQNKFRFYKAKPLPNEPVKFEIKYQDYIVEAINDLPQPLAYAKHFAYINFSRFDQPTPIYVNLVRDPVERVISWFYYIRSPK
jgi:dermatan/chondrotin sulfate uronyl 2-O-sulfotransferase UST